MAVESDVLAGIISALNVLNTKAGKNYTPISDAWELTQGSAARPFTRRTFLNYIEKLRTIYGVPIDFKQREGLRLLCPVEIPARLLEDYAYVNAAALETLTPDDLEALKHCGAVPGSELAGGLKYTPADRLKS